MPLDNGSSYYKLPASHLQVNLGTTVVTVTYMTPLQVALMGNDGSWQNVYVTFMGAWNWNQHSHTYTRPPNILCYCPPCLYCKLSVTELAKEWDNTCNRNVVIDGHLEGELVLFDGLFDVCCSTSKINCGCCCCCWYMFLHHDSSHTNAFKYICVGLDQNFLL